MSLKESWQLEKQHRQHAVIERKQEVQHLLSETGQARQLTAAALQSDLDDFVQTLKHQTAELLSNTAADRVLIAQQIEVLRSDVQSYLCELETQRQKQAKQLWQDLQASRTEREIEVQQLFNRFSEFRVELQHFHRTLQDYVWGTETSESANLEALSAPQVASQSNVAVSKQEPAKKNGAKTSPTISSSVQKSSLPKSATKSNRDVKPTQPDSSPEVDHEKAVYNFLRESQGARLTQIEVALNLNRFQTVDALRSLIKKGLITQRDRVYLLQESI